MRLVFALAIVLAATPAFAERTGHLTKIITPADGRNSRVEFPVTPAKAADDTTYLLGGPDRWDGSFETPGGDADWHGWTHEDLTVVESENHWHVSTYRAEYIEGHGIGNHALYCGDETIPACDPPDTIGGIGPDWLDDVVWERSVADNSRPVTVRLTGLMNYDLPDLGWDFLELYVRRGLELDLLESWTGSSDTTVTIDFTTVVEPGEFLGPGLDEVALLWRVWTSTDGWDDTDCISPSHGACQIDDLAVYFDDVLVTFDDFEPGSTVNWEQGDPWSVGDFANLRNDLGEIDPCLGNTSWQVNFLDDGVVVPGTGGTPCYIWCYDPGGWQVNNTGGLLAGQGDWFLENQIVSPPIPWVPGNDAAHLAFDVYRHESLSSSASAGVFYLWKVRSTDSADPADLLDAPWVDRNRVFHGGPEFFRQEEPVTDLVVPDRQWVQIALIAHELGWVWGFNGPHGSPAPYFDNVAFKTWSPDGPSIYVYDDNLFGDAFPEIGLPDPANPGANWCRVDMVGTTSVGVRGDSLAARIEPLRQGAVVTGTPSLHWVLDCNPVFDVFRSDVPDPQGILRGMVSGSPAIRAGGNPDPDQWAFDLPDTGFFYPGDRFRYYITASDDLDGDVRTAVWPPDTTGIDDFTPSSPFPGATEIRGLPTLTQPVAGQFENPDVLFFVDSEYDQGILDTWSEALEELGLTLGADYDLLRTRILTDMASLEDLSQYQTLLYSSWPQGFLQDWNQEDEAGLVNAWLDLGGRKALFAGDDFVSGTGRGSGSSGALLNRMGVNYHTFNITGLNGGVRDLQISPVAGNGVVPDDVRWLIADPCPVKRDPDAISAEGPGQAAATLDPEGSSGGTYSALVTVDDQGLGNRTVVMPYDLDRVTGFEVGPAKSDKALSPRAYLLNYLLVWLGSDLVSDVDDVPGAGRVTVSAHPNPFNPATTIAFELPRAGEVSLDIFDLQGRLVRRLLDESPYAAGSHKQVWDGRDASGRATSSGVYFYRFSAAGQKRVGKLTLLK